ncbi:hypothetical protein D3C73_908200 [compost metagenome]
MRNATDVIAEQHLARLRPAGENFWIDQTFLIPLGNIRDCRLVVCLIRAIFHLTLVRIYASV